MKNITKISLMGSVAIRVELRPAPVRPAPGRFSRLRPAPVQKYKGFWVPALIFTEIKAGTGAAGAGLKGQGRFILQALYRN